MSKIVDTVVTFVTKTVPEFVKAHPWETAATVLSGSAAVGGTVYAIRKNKTKKTEPPKLSVPVEDGEAEYEVETVEENA